MIEKLFKSLYRIRRVEEEVARIYPSDSIKSPIHLSTGQEAIAVGVCMALRPEDVVFGTYRGHALYLSKGGDLKRMMAELYGKSTGCCKGKGGSMHLIDLKDRVMGTSAIVATTIPQAVGYSYALKLIKSSAAVAVFFGDGATEEGVFHESLNLSALKKLPLLFVCENNRYAVFTPIYKRQAVDNIYERAKVYGIQSTRIENGDIFEIYNQTEAALARIRKGAGPQFLECLTYRWKEHVGPNEDYDIGYRTREEAQYWMQNDQVKRVADLLPAEKRDKIKEEIESEIQEAIAFAESSPFPDEKELCIDLFKE